MKKRYVLPVIILVILILLMAFRWDTQATKSYNNGVAKWKQDCWTGEIWFYVYKTRFAEKTPTRYEEEKIGPITMGLTLAWWGLFIANIIWLLVVFLLRGKEETAMYADDNLTVHTNIPRPEKKSRQS